MWSTNLVALMKNHTASSTKDLLKKPSSSLNVTKGFSSQTRENSEGFPLSGRFTTLSGPVKNEDDLLNNLRSSAVGSSKAFNGRSISSSDSPSDSSSVGTSSS
jgi:hypothetical protein